MYSFTATGSSMSHVTLSSAWPLSLTPCPLTGHPHIWCWLLLGSLWQMWTLSSPRSPAAWVAGPVCWCLVPAGPGWPDITHHRWDTETQGPQISAYVHKYLYLSLLCLYHLSCKWGLEPTGCFQLIQWKSRIYHYFPPIRFICHEYLNVPRAVKKLLSKGFNCVPSYLQSEVC